nr:hypothetical protein [Tanacetum cinerariifolium]
MLVAREPEEQGDTEEHGNADNAIEQPITAASEDDVAQDLEIIKLKTRVKKLERTNKGRMIDELDKDDGAVLMNEKEETKEVR